MDAFNVRSRQFMMLRKSKIREINKTYDNFETVVDDTCRIYAECTSFR